MAYNTYNNQNNQNNNGGSGSISWIVIAALFAVGLWPVAMIMLFYKLFVPTRTTSYQRQAPSLSEQEARRQAEERAAKLEKERQANQARENFKAMFNAPKDGKKQSMILTLVGAGLAAMTLAGLVTSVGAFTFWQALTLIATFISSCALIFSGVSMNKALSRYAKYTAIIGVNDAVEIETLATKTGFSVKRVTKDIEKMIEKGYFGESAYVNKELGYFFKSSQADEELAEAREAAMKKAGDAAKKVAAKQAATMYEQILDQIRDVNERIPGEEMTEKITKIEDITRQIFEAVEKEPKKRVKIDKFMSYYLPTTLKLLEHYASLEKAVAGGENVSKSRKSIENAMDSIVEGFSNQLDNLFKDDSMDIESDIDVMVQMMGRERKKASDDFKVKKEDSKTELDLGGMAGQSK